MEINRPPKKVSAKNLIRKQIKTLLNANEMARKTILFARTKFPKHNCIIDYEEMWIDYRNKEIKVWEGVLDKLYGTH